MSIFFLISGSRLSCILGDGWEEGDVGGGGEGASELDVIGR